MRLTKLQTQLVEAIEIAFLFLRHLTHWARIPRTPALIYPLLPIVAVILDLTFYQFQHLIDPEGSLRPRHSLLLYDLVDAITIFHHFDL